MQVIRSSVANEANVLHSVIGVASEVAPIDVCSLRSENPALISAAGRVST